MSLINFIWLTREHFLAPIKEKEAFLVWYQQMYVVFLFHFTLLYNLVNIVKLYIHILIPHFCYVHAQGLTNTLPTSCTSKFSPTLVKMAPHYFFRYYNCVFLMIIVCICRCFFPENLLQDIQTPMFLIESVFDQLQVYG